MKFIRSAHRQNSLVKTFDSKASIQIQYYSNIITEGPSVKDRAFQASSEANKLKDNPNLDDSQIENLNLCDCQVNRSSFESKRSFEAII